MMRSAPRAQYAEHQQEKSPTTNNQRQQHGNHSTAGIGFMSVR
jgi:hypothetical protein